MKTVLIFAICAFAAVSAIDPPSFLKICRQSDPNYSDCLAEAATKAIVGLANGLKSFKILPVEPLAVDNIRIGESQGSVSLRQEYRNIKIYGLTKGLRVRNYSFDAKKLVLSSDSYNPQVDFVADYTLDGRILVLPIKGTGKSNITMYDLASHNDIYCEKYENNGETYLRVKKYAIKFNPGRVSLRFDNLFNGDDVLAEPVNNFLSQNGDTLFKELQEPYEESFGLIFAKICNEIFSRIPMNKLFPQ